MTSARKEVQLVSEIDAIEHSSATIRCLIAELQERLSKQQTTMTRYSNRIESMQSKINSIIESTTTTRLQIERELNIVANYLELEVV